MDVPVPRRRSAVLHRVAHEIETRVARSLRVHDAPAGAHGVIVEAEGHRIGRVLVHESIEIQPGLGAELPLASGRIARPSFPGPDLFLPFHHALEAVPQGTEPVRGNHSSKHEKAVFDQLTRIEMHVRITVKRRDAGRCPRRNTGSTFNLHPPVGMSRTGRHKSRLCFTMDRRLPDTTARTGISPCRKDAANLDYGPDIPENPVRSVSADFNPLPCRRSAHGGPDRLAAVRPAAHRCPA